MKLKPLLILLFNIAVANAQQIHIKGSVVDSATNQTIPGVTVGLLNKNLFYRANDDGQFDVAASSTDSISFSCIGYKTQKLIADKVGLIKLSPINTTLSEVKIAGKAPQLIKVGSKKGSAFMDITLAPGGIATMYMKGSANMGGTIKSVAFNLSNGNILSPGKGDATAPFRIRVFAVDTSGKPGQELTKDIIVVSAKHGGWFEVDVSAYKIKNPEKGFFVAFCLLNHEYYVDQNIEKNHSNMPFSAYIKSPRLSGTKNDDKEVVSYSGTEQPRGVHWFKYPTFNETLIRATVAVD